MAGKVGLSDLLNLFPGFIKQQTGQAFLVVIGALWMFYKAEAPELLYWIVGANGALFIVFEKIRVTINGKPKDPT